MARDFSAQKYAHLCEALVAAGYRSLRFDDYLAGSHPGGKWVILRHDVDRFPAAALALARIEQALGLTASYYIRVPGTLNPTIIRQIYALGHEIGLHYEVLDKAGGDLQRAAAMLKEDLAELRALAPVTIAAMHGNPLTPFNNREIWEELALDEYGILGEAYLSVNFSECVYFSDTGRTWETERFNIYDYLPAGAEQPNDSQAIRTTNDLIDFIGDSQENLYILTHPERWPTSFSRWVLSATMDAVVNPLKLVFQFLHRLGGQIRSV